MIWCLELALFSAVISTDDKLSLKLCQRMGVTSGQYYCVVLKPGLKVNTIDQLEAFKMLFIDAYFDYPKYHCKQTSFKQSKYHTGTISYYQM